MHGRRRLPSRRPPADDEPIALQCPGENQIVAFALGDLAQDEARAIEAHIDTCATCAELVADAARARTDSLRDGTVYRSETAPACAPVVEPFGPGRLVGRYRVVERLGAGGMGVVYRAHDPELDRDVALKVLRSRPRGTDADGHARLLREAQLTAQLSHPNVVNVFEVGVEGDHLFVSMELVEGKTLKQWLDRGPHPLAAVIDVFVQAGRGLAAAHAAGVVHRDFKPDNIIVGTPGGDSHRPGRVRVMDFGLARLVSDSQRNVTDERTATAAASELSSSTGSSTSMSDRLTATGTVMGTPAYMAPEQHIGRAVDESSDQYAFCVALYEAVDGKRPFAGRTVAEIAMRKQRGIDRRSRAAPRIPGWLYAALRRGLAVDPQRRFATMDGLVRALERGPRRRRTLAVATGSTALAVGAVAWAARASNPVGDPCAALHASMDETWNDAQRRRIRSALVSADLPYAETTAARVEALVTDYSGRWIDARIAACRAARDEADELGPRACLERARLELGALLEVLADADAEVTGRAVRAVAGLAPPSECAAASEAGDRPADPAVARKVDALDKRLLEAGALHRAGRYGPGLEIAHEVEVAARELDHPPILERALAEVGRLAALQSELDEAERALTEAYFSANQRGDAASATDVAILLAGLMGTQKVRTDEGHAWIRHAEAELGRFEAPKSVQADLLRTLASIHQTAGEYEASLHKTREAMQLVDASNPAYADYFNNVGTSLFLLGRYDDAKAEHERALELRLRDLGEGHPVVADSHSALGACAFNLGDYATSIEQHERALAIWQGAFGADHHDVAIAHNNLAGALHALGRYGESIEHYTSAIEIFTKVLGAEHPNVALIHNNLGNVLHSENRCDDALPHYRRALEIRRAAYGPAHPDLAATMNNEAICLMDMGRLDDARKELQEAMRIQQEALGESHPDLGHTLSNLGLVVRKMGNPEDAIDLHRRALTIRRVALDDEHVDIGESHYGLGASLLAAGRAADAVPELETALQILAPAEGSARDTAATKLALARALWATRDDRPRARRLASEASTEYARIDMPDSAREAAQWAAEHR